jgi:Protein of unknown function VcgC/VcgE (DUF2780)
MDERRISMDDIIRELSTRLGLSPDQAAAGAGAILKTLQDNVAQADFQKLLQQVPQAQAWIGRVVAGGPSEGGTGLLGMAGGLLGSLGAGGTSSLGELATLLSRNGLSLDTATRLGPALIDLLGNRVDPGLIERLVSSIPGLGSVLSGSGSNGSGRPL